MSSQVRETLARGSRYGAMCGNRALKVKKNFNAIYLWHLEQQNSACIIPVLCCRFDGGHK